MDGLSAESGVGHRGDSRIFAMFKRIFAMFKYACISWLVNGTLKIHFVRKSHVGMLTQHEVFLQAGVQV